MECFFPPIILLVTWRGEEAKMAAASVDIFLTCFTGIEIGPVIPATRITLFPHPFLLTFGFACDRVMDAVFNFLLVWYYCTLTIRESILISNGSK